MLTQQKPVCLREKTKPDVQREKNQENIQLWREKNRDFNFLVLAPHEA